MTESVLFLALVVLQLADATCTELFYRQIGEGNPFMQYVIEQTGFTGLYVVKGIVVMAALIMAYIGQVRRTYLPTIRFALAVAVVIEVLAVGAWALRFLVYLTGS
jgi:hypothetical protein